MLLYKLNFVCTLQRLPSLDESIVEVDFYTMASDVFCLKAILLTALYTQRRGFI